MKMGDQGRSSADNCAAVVMLVLLMSMAVAVQATSHIVGTSAYGWQAPGLGNSLNSSYYQDWANSQSFAAGDILIFTYNASEHNVLKVMQIIYSRCNSSGVLKVYNSGNDSITIDGGTHSFMCGRSTHCSKGQRFVITITTSTINSTASQPTGPPPSQPAAPPPSSGNVAFRHGATYAPLAFAAMVFTLLSALAS